MRRNHPLCTIKTVSTRGRVLTLVVVLVVGGVLGALLVGARDGTPGQVVAACSDDRGDADRIQSAIDGSSEGDEIVFDGPCLVDETIVLLGRRAYRGESPTTTLTAAPGSNLRTVLASDSWALDKTTTGDPISLRDLTVDAARDRNPDAGDGVTIRSWHSQIEDLRILDARENCLRVTSRSRNGTDLGEKNTQVNGTLRSIFTYHCGTNGIYVEDKVNAVTDWHLDDSWIGDTGEDGIRMENAAGWTLQGNHVFDAGGNGIVAFRLFATSISDSYVEDFGRGSGIAAQIQGDAGSVVHDNRVFQAGDFQGGSLMEIVGAREGTSTATVTGNVLLGNGSGTGLAYRTEGATLSMTSEANNVSRVQTPISGVPTNKGY